MRGIIAVAMIGVAAFLGGGSEPRAAESASVRLRQQAQQACFGDAQQFCADVLADDAKTTACMKANKAKLSPPCLKVYDRAFGR